MQCPKCKFENRKVARFCKKCGERLEHKCASCGSPYEADSIFCDQCGHGLSESEEAPAINYNQPQSYTPKFLADKILTTRRSIEGERKLVTVLFADVANYTAISEQLDPEEVHRIMDGCFKILLDQVHKYEGTIDKFTGDGVMVLFGAPVAHEDHAQRACYAALSMQKAIGVYGERIKEKWGKKFKMRFGLNSGTVVVGSVGDDLRMDYTAIGDTTNLASRMERMAEPGRILVSDSTHNLTVDFFVFQALGKVPVKGKKVPQAAFELIKAREVATRIEAAAAKGLTRFVGRKKEIKALKEAFESAKSGSGQVVGIVGEAGVGKSRLLLEFRGMLPEDDYTYLQGRCLHYGAAMPYLPFLDILKTYFDIKEEDREDEIKKKVRERFSTLDDKAEDVPPALHELLSLQVEDEKYVQLEPRQRREHTFEAIRDLFIRESRKKPLFLVAEDLHWMDNTSEAFIAFLIDSLPTARILLILLYRPEYTHSWGSKSCYGKIRLDQLSAQTSAELVQAILEGGKVAPEISGLVLGKAGGNPLFVEELTHSLVENDAIQKQENIFVLARNASEIKVPDTIQGIIAARMDRIEDNLKRIMQVASVIGRAFAYRILKVINGMSGELKASLLRLQGLEFIYEKQLFPELEYIFKHALTQEVAYNSLLLKRRKEIHEKIGKAIEEIFAERLEDHYEVLAYHYVSSANTVKAVDYLDLANRKAAEANAMSDAKACFDKAMELLDTLPDTPETREQRISLLVNQSNVFLMLLKMTEYYNLLTCYEPVAADLENLGLRGAFYGRLGFYEIMAGHFDHSIQTLTKAAKLCEAAGNAENAGYAYFSLAYSHLIQGSYDRALAFKEDALRKMEESFNLRFLVRVLAAACNACAELGRFDQAVEEGKKALNTAQDYSDNSLISWAASMISVAYTHKRDLDQAIRYGELAVAKAPTPSDKAGAQLFLAWAWCHRGEPDKGLDVLVELVPLLQAIHIVPYELAANAFLADGYRLAGEYEKGRHAAEEILKLADRCGSKIYIGYAYLLLGQISLLTNPFPAAAHFEKSIAVFLEIKAENYLALAYSGMGRFHKQQGNPTQAHEYLSKALEIFERLGTLIEPDKVRKELAELPEKG